MNSFKKQSDCVNIIISSSTSLNYHNIHVTKIIWISPLQFINTIEKQQTSSEK